MASSNVAAFDKVESFLDICILYTYLFSVEAEWDPAKARSNLARHGIRFADAATVLNHEFTISIPDLGLIGEERFVAVGADAGTRNCGVVYLSAKQDSHHLGTSRNPIRTERVWKKNTTLVRASEGQ